MKRLLLTTTAALLAIGIVSSASAEKANKRHSNRSSMTTQEGMTTGQARSGSYTGGNAALQGNNGNSGQGDNSLGHIKGGNVGAGK